MKKSQIIAVAGVALLSVTALYAHDLFIKMDSYFVAANSAIRIPVINGTFAESDGSITPDRLLDLSLVTPTGRQHPDTTAWSVGDNISYLDVRTGEPGTYVVGISTKTREIGLSAEDFNGYLEHDGIPDVLEARRQAGNTDEEVWERYAKHVKAVFQVGDRRTDGFDVELGYPAEIVLLNNPYTLQVGGELRVRCLVDGKPVANQYVLAGGELGTTALSERSARTDANGEATFKLDSPGKWYVRFIHMTESDDADIDYRSKWATITFEIRAQAPAEVVTAFHEAVARGDTVQALAYLHPDVVIFESGGAEMSRDEFTSGHLGADMAFAAATTREVTNSRTVLEGDIAVVMNRNSTSGMMGDREINSVGVETVVLWRSGGAWTIVHIHWSSRRRR